MGCDSGRGARAAVAGYILEVEKGNDRGACAAVWWGDADPAHCRNLAEFVRAHRAELGPAPSAEATDTYGHGTGAHVTLRGSGDFRIMADLLCSEDPRMHQPGPRCRWYLVDWRER